VSTLQRPPRHYAAPAWREAQSYGRQGGGVHVRLGVVDGVAKALGVNDGQVHLARVQLDLCVHGAWQQARGGHGGSLAGEARLRSGSMQGRDAPDEYTRISVVLTLPRSLGLSSSRGMNELSASSVRTKVDLPRPDWPVGRRRATKGRPCTRRERLPRHAGHARAPCSSVPQTRML